jgi:hypothetical protein
MFWREAFMPIAGYLGELHFSVRIAAIFALGTRGDASAIPALEALLNSNDLSIEMSPMLMGQIEHLKNPSGPAGVHAGTGAVSSDGAPKPSENERLIHLEQLVEEMNDRLKIMEGRLPAVRNP